MRILLIGHGKMGQLLVALAQAQGHQVTAVISSRDHESLAFSEKVDVAMDFSHPDMLPDLAAFVRRTGTPLCCGTTGYTKAQMDTLQNLKTSAPILYSANFSFGIAVFRRILSQISPMLMDSFDIEMVEAHHNEKIDAPSGTAHLLAEAIDPTDSLERIYGRSGQCGSRTKKEMGIFSLRGGTVNGTHTVSFFGDDETLSITHSATSRQVFVNGAMRAALILAERPAGWYQLNDILFSQEQ